jgi:hypothetical protein
MFHPFEGDLSELKDSEIEDKVTELTRKYFQASRLGKPELLTQISTFLTIYKEEMSKRLRTKTQSNIDGDLDQLINVD